MDNDSLVILWSSGDKEVATKMVFMYALNAKKRNWWKSVTLIVWGPSSKLLSQDEELRAKVVEMKNEGINLEACKACADQYGVSDSLTALGIEVKYMGMPLTEYMKRGDHILTF